MLQLPAIALRLTPRSPDAAMHEAVPAIAACGVSPIVRIPDNQGFMVKRAVSLDKSVNVATY